jgi:autotransporter-associated beta strand protein
MFRTWYRRWLNWIGRVAAPRQRPTEARRRSSRRLLLEALEDRLAPATHTWTGAVSSNWSDANNWIGGSPYTDHSSPIAVVFPATGVVRFTSTVDNTLFQDVDSLTFNQSGFTINGASLIFNGNTTITANNTSGANTIANVIDQEPVVMGAFEFFDHVYQVAGSSTVNIAGQITSHSSSNLLDKTGTGVLKLSAASNNYTGPTDIHGGTLLVGAINNLPNQTAVSVDAGATFDLGGTNLVIGSLAGAGNVNLTGTLLTGGNNQSTTFGGIFNSIGNLVKEGTGTFTLTATNGIHPSEVGVDGGILRLGNMDSLPFVSIVPGATLDLNNQVETIGLLEGSGHIILGSGTLNVATSGEGATYSGIINGTGSLVKQASTVPLVLSGPNTYSGATTILGGTLRLGANNAVPSASALTVEAGATFDLNNFNETIGCPSGGGNIALGSGTLTIGANNASGVSATVISGSGGVTKVGTGTCALFSHSTYSGPTLINAGTLQLGGSINSDVTVNNTGTLDGGGSVGNLTVNAGGTVSPGANNESSVLECASATFRTGSFLQILVNNISTDELLVSGVIDLTGQPTLNITVSRPVPLGLPLPNLISTSSTVQGNFNGLPDGAVFTAGGERFQIQYLASRVNITHIADPASHFVINTVASTQAGAPFDFTVTALDPNNNIDTVYTGTVHFTSQDPFGATLPADYTFTAADRGTHTFSGGATLFTAGSWDVTATETTSGITGNANVLVTPAAAVQFVVTAPPQANSGVPFDLTVTAADPYGNTDTNYQGTVTFTSSDSDPGVILPADYTFQPGDLGSVTFPGGVTLITPGNQTVTVTDTRSGITGFVTVTL